jgi:asparagine synthase (glutamine-hydrolysing)
LKALRVFPSFKQEIDRDALALYLQHCYVPAPRTIYRDVRKLPPGSLLKLSPHSDSLSTTVHSYWSMKEAVQNGADEPFSGSAEDAVERFHDLLRDSVRARMLADVPLGAFLSGGYDSTTIVALMQSQSPRPAKTFSIGFHEAGYDEAPYARAVADKLGTEHCETYVSAQEAQDVVPRLPQIYDEPFADSSQIPTYLVSQIARREVTVSLSGDGGDELLGGYERYDTLNHLWKRIEWMPLSLRRVTAPALKACLPQRGGGVLARRLRTLSDFLTAPNARQLYTRFFTHWKDPCRVVTQSGLPLTTFYDCDNWPARRDRIEELMYVDSVTYLPDDILVKVDRASMAVSLEARVPFLDHHVVEFAWTLPMEMKSRAGSAKWILRKLLDRYIPPQLVDRPKVGFGVPIDSWLRGPLREWGEELLSSERLKSDGFFDPRPLRTLWEQHLRGEQDWHYHLWDVLMFQAWHDANKA